MRFKNPADFLGWLNECVVIHVDPKGTRFVERPQVERQGYGQQCILSLEQPKRLVWAVEVDRILEGPCPPRDYQSVDLDKFPMGKCVKYANQPDAPDKSWLHESLALEGMKDVKRILVFAECCGSYSPEYQARIRRLFPQIEWMFVEVRDLCENSYNHPVEIADDFVRAGVLRIE